MEMAKSAAVGLARRKQVERQTKRAKLRNRGQGKILMFFFSSNLGQGIERQAALAIATLFKLPCMNKAAEICKKCRGDGDALAALSA